MKAVVIFVVFLILDIVLDVVFSNINGGLPLVEYYVVAIFLEIAFFRQLDYLRYFQAWGNHRE